VLEVSSWSAYHPGCYVREGQGCGEGCGAGSEQLVRLVHARKLGIYAVGASTRDITATTADFERVASAGYVATALGGLATLAAVVIATKAIATGLHTEELEPLAQAGASRQRHRFHASPITLPTLQTPACVQVRSSSLLSLDDALLSRTRRQTASAGPQQGAAQLPPWVPASFQELWFRFKLHTPRC
jgi:hypothetical protein